MATISLEKPVAAGVAIQLEIPLIDALGKVKSGGCQSALVNFTNPLALPFPSIPGLDACLCRCPKCQKKSGGVWWYSQQMRDRLLSRKTIMITAIADGESLRDSE